MQILVWEIFLKSSLKRTLFTGLNCSNNDKCLWKSFNMTRMQRARPREKLRYIPDKLILRSRKKLGKMWKELQIRNIRELNEVFKNFDIRCWLDYGTLLGAIRNGKFIDWDDDIGLGTTDDNWCKIISAIPQFERRGFHVQTTNLRIYDYISNKHISYPKEILRKTGYHKILQNDM